jgi:hypothetical protein
VIYYTTNQDNDVTTFDGQEPSTGINWSTNTWYRVQVIADQTGKTFDLKITNKSTNQSSTASALSYNDAAAGNIQKIWFGVSTQNPAVYFDNIYIYEDTVSPPLNGPTIIFQDYSVGPTGANNAMDIDFEDDVDLQSIQYKIGSGGSWTDLTSDGTNAIDLRGAGPHLQYTTPVYMTDADFAGLSDGESHIYFRATDSDAQTTESAAYVSFSKDATSPQLSSVTLTDSGNNGAGTGDTITLVFDEALSASSISAALIGANTNNALAAGSGNITGSLADIIAEMGSFATATTATADATTLNLSADGTTVTITLGGTVSDGAFPAGIFTPAASYEDLAGNTVNTGVTQTTTGTWDSTAPQLSSAVLQDLDADGRIDAVTLTFDEDVLDASFVPSQWTFNGNAATAIDTGTTVDDDTVNVLYGPDDLPIDTSQSGAAIVFLNGTSVTDLHTNNLAAIANVAETEGAGPAILSAQTVTATTVEVTFSENINDATLATADFIFAGFATGGANTNPGSINSGAANDDIVTLTLSAAIAPDETGTIALTASGVISDLPAAGSNPSSQTAAVSVTDGIAPTVTSITSATADNTYGMGANIDVTVTFSEPMDTTTNPSPTITGLASAYTITGSTWSGGDTQWIGSFTLIDDNEEATGTFQISGFEDAGGNMMTLDNGNTVSVDTLSPTLNSVSISSDNTNTALAVPGDTVTISFSSSELLSGPPAVTIDGNAADNVTDLGLGNYTADRLMQAGDTEDIVSFTINFSDTSGNAGTQVISTTDASAVVFDNSPPSVSQVSSPSANGTYYRGDTVDITITFSETVTVDTAGGTPTLLLETGSTDRSADYISGSGADTLTFRYTVQQGDSSSDLDCVDTSSLQLKGGTIQDLAANPAVLTLPAPGAAGSLSANKDLVIDGLLSDEQGNVIIRNNIINPRQGEVTTLNFRLDERSTVTTTVYDLAGDSVKILYNQSANAGMTELVWDGKSKRGKAVVPGVYFIVVKIGKDRYVRKVLVVK